jgi:VWFA-related protein
MERRRPLSFAILLVPTMLLASLLIFPLPRSAAANTQAAQQDHVIRVGVPLVNLYATVYDKRKVNVPNLEQNDFRVFEDNVEQKITFFSREKTLPLELGLLIDTSGSEANMIAAEQQAASQFFHRVLQKDDKAFVVAFDVTAVLLADWQSDVDSLDRSIRRATAGVGGNRFKPGQFPRFSGGTHLFDAIQFACRDKMASESGRKALIILTDASDRGSLITTEQAVEAAQRANTLIQVLVVYQRKRDANFGVAKKLAEETGGHAIDVDNQKRLQAAFDEISEELRTEYSLGYYPTNSKPDGTYRRLRLEMIDKNYKALTRTGYYARNQGN